jgi:hypothetical protein
MKQKPMDRICSLDVHKDSVFMCIFTENGKNAAKILGHSSIRLTQHYVKVLNQSILKEMQGVE